MTETAQVNAAPAIETPSLGVLSEIHTRLAAIEKSQADLHAKVDAATKSGVIDGELLAHLAHIAGKHFHHDRPEAVN